MPATTPSPHAVPLGLVVAEVLVAGVLVEVVPVVSPVVGSVDVGASVEAGSGAVVEPVASVAVAGAATMGSSVQDDIADRMRRSVKYGFLDTLHSPSTQ